MITHDFLFGPVLSRRLGYSLGICPIPYSHCNYACIYCYLGRTQHLENTRQAYFSTATILKELEAFLKLEPELDVISIVGDGEPTLYADLGNLIRGIRAMTDHPVAVITNGALMGDVQVRLDLMEADLVLPSLDAYDVESFKCINRPHGTLDFDDMVHGLQTFSKDYEGYMWLETMLIKGINDNPTALEKLHALFRTIDYQKLYLNIPIRMTAEAEVNIPDQEALLNAFRILGGFSLELLPRELLGTSIEDDFEAMKEVLGLFTLNELEIKTLMRSRRCQDVDGIMDRLGQDPDIVVGQYKRFKDYSVKLHT